MTQIHNSHTVDLCNTLHKCPRGQDDQTMNHLLFHCTRTSTQRELLKHQISKQRNWPASKQELISKHRKWFSAYIESINFELLQ